jgi:hypothetical protein
MLNKDQIEAATKLLNKVLTLRESKERLQIASNFAVSSFMSDVIVSVPEAEVETIRTIALDAISKQIVDAEEKLKALGVTAD